MPRQCEEMITAMLLRAVLLLLVVSGSRVEAHFASVQSSPVDCEFSDPSCGWEWSEGFLLLSAENTTALGPTAPGADSESNVKGQFLYYSASDPGQSETLEVVSPMFDPFTLPTCQLEMTLHMFNMEQAVFKVIMKAPNSTWESNIFNGDNAHQWRIHKQMIGTVRQPFNVILEVIVHSSVVPSHLAIDSIEAVECYMRVSEATECVARQFQCSDLICIDASKVCDTNADCLYGEDEDQECYKLPEPAYCTFEANMCGWNSSSRENSEWIRHRGESPNQRTGPSFDHTFQNESGTYLLAKFPPGRSFGIDTTFSSPWFPPPPIYHRTIGSQYYNSCQVRFFFHKYGDRMGELRLDILEQESGTHLPRINQLWRSYGNKGNIWWPAVVTLPAVSHKFQLQFIASRGMDHSDIAIDDITLSPECFHIGVSPNASLISPDNIETEKPELTGRRSVSQTRFSFTTCGARGRLGPNDTLCHNAYQNSSTKVIVVNEPTMEGIQKWTVPSDGLYTMFLKGAGGGTGVKHRGKEDVSLGTYLRATFDWKEGDVIYVLIGQKGRDACSSDNTIFLHRMCETVSKRDINIIRDMNRKRNEGGGGGGGGATYVFKMDPETYHKVPVAIAGGGGGLSAMVSDDEALVIAQPHGMGPNNSIAPINGYTGSGAGGGGGWEDTTTHISSGQSLREGGRGGEVCRRASVWVTDGGFGGGGGGCASGGGGGGYRGGDASPTEGPFFNGQGGTSYLMPGAIRALVEPGYNEGEGSAVIIPAQKGCGCDYMCVMLDLESKAYYCICPAHLTINIDGFSCNGHDDNGISSTMIAAMVLGVLIMIGLGSACYFFTTVRMRKLEASRDISHEPLNNPEVQLSRLRNTGGMVTEYNPNYEFGGSTCTVQDLREVPRDQLTLVKALGQGAFGEVYQGFLTNPNSEDSERPVAVKTLPELSSSQSGMDFLMEALIMSKFKHPNIVSFIGVCFEKLPRFIVLELLPGGDLKSFLRECRPKPSKESTLSMTDLLKLAMDIAKGCQYMEENHFIHRDIAARNCLLTTKEASRVVKIADFGMARDIYRADYYRKGGKAMLPVKWMPPEAFLDGIFTSKTDVWSFGVLLWELTSLGYMPYPGRDNQEVMQIVTSGGRLEPPTNCPSPVYHIMMQCWHPHPDERPHFTTIIERLGYCLQDPDVINAPLPIFNRAPSMEKDTTIMRPLDDDSGRCLQVHRPDPGLLLSPGSEDYLIPMPRSSSSAVSELQSSLGSSDQLLEMEERGGTPSAAAPAAFGETNFMTAGEKPLKKQGGYTEVPTDDPEPHGTDPISESPQKNGPIVANGPRKVAVARMSSIKSLDDLPLAPVANENAVCNKANAAKNQSNLSLDAGALVLQMSNPAANLPTSENPNRYVNVDVNCNTSGSNSSLSTTGRSGLTNRNPPAVSGPFDGYSGVNPVA